MRKQSVEVPRSLKEFGRWQREGEAGRRWLASLPDLVAEQCSRWSLRIDGNPMHGDNSLAVPVLRDHDRLVLKLTWPDESVAEQAMALRLWDGRGAVRLIDVDLTSGAFLLERLDNTRSLRDTPLAQAVPVIGALLRRLAVPAPSGLRSTAGLAAYLSHSLEERWVAAGRPFTRRVLDVALGLADELSVDAYSVLVNNDLHYDQVLSARREPWLVIDPQVVVGVLEYQVSQLLWTRFDEISSSSMLAWSFDALVDAGELDPALARSWALLRAVEYWLWGLEAGLTEDPIRCRGIVEGLLE